MTNFGEQMLQYGGQSIQICPKFLVIVTCRQNIYEKLDLLYIVCGRKVECKINTPFEIPTSCSLSNPENEWNLRRDCVSTAGWRRTGVERFHPVSYF